MDRPERQKPIVNPNVEEKMKYIDRTYNEDLVHANCKDIYIEQACICADFGPSMMFFGCIYADETGHEGKNCQTGAATGTGMQRRKQS